MENLQVKNRSLKNYFTELFGMGVQILDIKRLGVEEKEEIELKGFGYGIPYVIELLVNGKLRKLVLETIRPSGFGHEHVSDRAQTLIWQHSAFNNIPRHIRSIDVGAFTTDNSLKTLGDCKEYFMLTEFAEGKLYFQDLDIIREKKTLAEMDVARCKALSDYLVELHSVKGEGKASLYIRRIRELIGHGECIMGLADSFPDGLEYVSENFLSSVEKKCIDWRWEIKKKTHRCARVHGDFHPWNILFREGEDFTVLDRSRGEWGEPADDVTSMSVNYLFYALQTHGRLDGSFKELFMTFWNNYLNKTGDEEILTVVQPFYAWRGLVIASPIWYPNLPLGVRQKIFNFIRNVLETEKFDPESANSLLSA